MRKKAINRSKVANCLRIGEVLERSKTAKCGLDREHKYIRR